MGTTRIDQLAFGGFVSFDGGVTYDGPRVRVFGHEFEEVFARYNQEEARIGDAADAGSHFAIAEEVFEAEDLADADDRHTNRPGLTSLALSQSVIEKQFIPVVAFSLFVGAHSGPCFETIRPNILEGFLPIEAFSQRGFHFVLLRRVNQEELIPLLPHNLEFTLLN